METTATTRFEEVNQQLAELAYVDDDDNSRPSTDPELLDGKPPVGSNGQGVLTVGRERPQFHRITCRELDSTIYQLDYLIDGTLVANQPCVVAGGKKTLKTSIVIDMGISLAMGGYFLGKLKVNRAARVGIMSGESGMAVIQETARRICQSAGYQLGDISNLVFSESLPQFDNPAHLLGLREFIQADELEVLCIDPTYMAMKGADAGNLFIQGDLLRSVNEVCAEMGVTLVLVHHCRKGGKADPFAPPELEDIAWAGFQEWCRQWLLIGRRERYEAGTGQHRLWLNVGGSAGHSALWAADINEGVQPNRHWGVETYRASVAREDSERRREAAKEAAKEKQAAEQLERDRKQVCRALAKRPEGETKTALAALAGMGRDRLNMTLGSLLEDESVVMCEVVKPDRKTPRDGYKLADDNPP